MRMIALVAKCMMALLGPSRMKSRSKVWTFAKIDVLEIKSSRRPENDSLYRFNYHPVLLLVFPIGLSLFLLERNSCGTFAEQFVNKEKRGGRGGAHCLTNNIDHLLTSSFSMMFVSHIRIGEE
jgi:hypothetical protein